MTKLIDYEQFCGITPAESEAAPSSPEDEGEATVEELKTRLDRHDSFLLLDVREPREFEICRIPGSVLIPLGDLPSRLPELEGARRHDCPLQVRDPQWKSGQTATRGRLQ